MMPIYLHPFLWNKFNSDCLHQHGLWTPCGIWASKTRFPLTPFCFTIHANWPEKLEKATCPPVSLQTQKCAEGEGKDIHGGRCERGVSKIMNNPDLLGNHYAYKNVHTWQIPYQQLPVFFWYLIWCEYTNSHSWSIYGMFIEASYINSQHPLCHFLMRRYHLELWSSREGSVSKTLQYIYHGHNCWRQQSIRCPFTV